MANALSVNFNGIHNCITSPVTLSNPFTGRTIPTSGIWDTGATNSVITRRSAEALGLKPISMARVNSVHGTKTVNVYYVEITLNNDQITLRSRVTECEELSPDSTVGMLVGMDIINMGDFCITNADGNTTMSFIVPSQRKIDFVEDIGRYNKYAKIHHAWAKSGNNKCPCNSGKLWSNCHGKIVYK